MFRIYFTESAETSVDSASSADSVKRAGQKKLNCNVIYLEVFDSVIAC